MSGSNRQERMLSRNFWSCFKDRYWEKEPGLFSQLFEKPLISPSEAFDAAVCASGLYRERDDNVAIRFYIEEGEIASALSKYLPRPSDGSLANYARRISRQINHRRFGFVLGEIQMYRVSIWQSLRDFLHDFYTHTGIPLQPAGATLFIGDYKKTPFGVHRGTSGNFKFIVDGRKRMRLWPSTHFRNDPRGDHFLNYERDLKASTALTGGPGDVIYWPSDSWHSGENRRGVSTSISLALFVEDRLSVQQEVLNEAVRYTQQKLDARGPTHSFAGDGSDTRRIRPLIKKTGKIFAKITEDPALEEVVVARYLNRITALGFTAVPPPAKADKLKSDSFIRLDPAYPVKWVRHSDQEIICSANGHSFLISAHPSVPRLFQLLNRGDRHRVGDLVDRYAGICQTDEYRFEAKRKDISDVLTKLLSLRAIQFCSAGL
jgi:50S ribosomal protein L16 3-hydroxylase